MINFICPVCSAPLVRAKQTYVCQNNHSFDISKKGYVNLLLSNKSLHGDDRQMVKARSAFLDKGYYELLKTELCNIIAEKIALMSATPKTDVTDAKYVILDAGCGECYYTSGFADNGNKASVIGIDLSKEAIICGSKRNPTLNLAVASVNQIPLPDRSVDIVISTFAPMAAEEFFRVLKNGGLLVRTFPLARHLWQLKEVLYEKVYENIEETDIPVGFRQLEFKDIRYTAVIEKDDIFNLFTMTPYYYRTTEQGVNRLKSLNSLETEIAFGITVYQKNS